MVDRVYCVYIVRAKPCTRYPWVSDSAVILTVFRPFSLHFFFTVYKVYTQTFTALQFYSLKIYNFTVCPFADCSAYTKFTYTGNLQFLHKFAGYMT